MFKLHYQINNNPQIEEEFSTYQDVSNRIVELRNILTSCSTFSVLIYDTDDNLIQGVNKL